MLGVSQSRGLKLFGREIIFEEFQPMCSRYLNVTDRQTDGRTDRRLTVASPRSALASRGKNRKDHEEKQKHNIRTRLEVDILLLNNLYKGHHSYDCDGFAWTFIVTSVFDRSIDDVARRSI